MGGIWKSFIVAMALASMTIRNVEGAAAFTGGAVAFACSACVLEWCGSIMATCGTMCAATVAGYPVCMGACVAIGCSPCAAACGCVESDAAVVKLGGATARLSEITEGDLLATLDNQSSQTRFTKVLASRTVKGSFQALNISIGAISLVVTPTHQVYLHDAGNIGTYKRAVDLSVGDRVWLQEGIGPISSIAHTSISEKTDIVTESCSMLVNGILVATCDVGVTPETIAQMLSKEV